ncbi:MULTISPECIES: DUF2624 domain-containing protein [Oceanobacillus]|uniref:DUF2624 domain-containing protein n=1 Tax=Oceanobacillus kimchii TaxID=746691 RepID=A0ABQ5TI84_9BACI|nr:MULTISPECIES: DUF2624 domain-containing protein [Oceanobacillus]MBT2598310.1 DUF2624 domain-containing protein [Oceanobacillus sp. ISL-74]MBT2651229.1 DUF2624 domain-containing protein [Oceanobacillus sp. ISL-73]MCT1575888.1 DUF2624 domain-containing protein [Oceanobacillus kimchii]MCT2135525.1 DUF2624 domain-containing protein [Oceanobacillus kimchii]OEH55629.1 hypothetical protein AQ616_05460 [Oceanobacillus sp. E9]
MSFFIKEMVKSKVRNLTVGELLHYSKQYNFHITEHQARQIINYLRTNSPDPFKASDRDRMFHELSSITDPQTAQQAQALMDEVIQSYGLGHLFN